MAEEKEEQGSNIAAVAYEAYRAHTGGKSLATGADIPEFAALPEAIKQAWDAAAVALVSHVKEQALKAQEAPTPQNPVDVEVLCPHCKGKLEATDFLGAPFGLVGRPMIATSCKHCHVLLSVTIFPPPPQRLPLNAVIPAFQVPPGGGMPGGAGGGRMPLIRP